MDTLLLPILAALVALSQLQKIAIRVGSTQINLSPASAGVLICVAFGGTHIAVLSAFLGVTAARLLVRQHEPKKLLFNAGKETLAAAAAGFAAVAVGLDPLFVGSAHRLDIPSTMIGLAAGALAYGLLDEALSLPLFSLISRSSPRELLLAHLDASLLGRAGALVLAAATIGLYSVNPWLVSIVVPSVYAIHLTSANLVRRREENEAWQRLAQATDELNAVDLNKVLTTAARSAAGIFSANEV
jgi:hypothetical protein